MRRHLIVLAVVTVLLTAGCSGVDDEAKRPPATTEPKGSGGGGGKLPASAALLTFDDCEPLLDRLQSSAAERVGPGGFLGGWGGGDVRTMESADGDAAAAAPNAMSRDASTEATAEEGTDFSGTNVQEEGVDEPDVVKTDGETLFVVRGNELISVDADGSSGQPLGRVAVPTQGSVTELLLVDDRVLVLSTSWANMILDGDVVPPATAAPDGGTTEKIAPDSDFSPTPEVPTTTLTAVDVSDPANLRITETVTVEGEYRTARMVDGVARVVLQSPGPMIPWNYPTSDSEGTLRESTETNRRLIDETTLDDWLPHRIDAETGAWEDLVDCDDVYVPASFAGTGLVTVLTVPVDGTGPLDPKAATLTASADTVYASTGSLYVAAHAWPNFEAGRRIVPTDDPGTDVHQFDITGEVAAHTASGHLDGYVLNQFSMSEHDERLRVATTSMPMWTIQDGEAESSSGVTVFERQGEKLAVVGSVGDLGKGETIRSVRYVGDTAYVVTFRQTDPFYVLDLSDPAAPAVVGELKLPGYSGYLHPIDETHVLGVGQEGDADGRITGVKVSLFDVSDPSAPVESANWTQQGGSQQVEFDAKAFLYWPATRLAVVPVQVFDQGDVVTPDDGAQFNGAVGLTVGDDAIVEAGRISHVGRGAPAYEVGVERSIVVGDTLWTLSSIGFLASDLRSLAPGTFVTLR